MLVYVTDSIFVVRIHSNFIQKVQETKVRYFKFDKIRKENCKCLSSIKFACLYFNNFIHKDCLGSQKNVSHLKRLLEKAQFMVME